MDTATPREPAGDAERAVLGEERRRTARQLEALSKNFEAFVDGAEYVNTDDEHDPEGATIAFERAQVIALRDDARQRLEALDRALERIDDGTYGHCTRCGGRVGVARLAALPGVATCIECASGGEPGGRH